MRDKRVQKILVQVAFTILWILVAGICIKVTVFGKDTSAGREPESYYQTLEKETVSQVREYLNSCGFENSGVTLTRVVETDGSREYTLTLHHSRMEKMEEAERIQLEKNLTRLFFEEEGCSFELKYLH